MLVDAELGANRWVGQVQHVEINGRALDSASELERIDAGVGEVPEELGPCRLLLVRGVPDAGFIRAV